MTFDFIYTNIVQWMWKTCFIIFIIYVGFELILSLYRALKIDSKK